MKKVATMFLAIILMACSFCTLTACDTTYDTFVEDGYEMGYSEELNEAFAYRFYWNGQVEYGIDIVIPNTYKGAPVTALGGFTGIGYPCGFDIYFCDQYEGGANSNLYQYLFGDKDYHYAGNCKYWTNTQEDVYNEIVDYLGRYDFANTSGFDVVDVVINLHFGSNLQRIECADGFGLKYYCFEPDEDNNVTTVYAFSYVVTVDEQNEYFYSDELGRMYYKENDELVKEFLYHNRDTFPEGSIQLPIE